MIPDLRNNDSGNWDKKWAASEIVRFHYEEFRSLIKHKGDWVGADFAQGYLSQLNGINLDRPINSLAQRRFVCLLSGHSPAYRRVHYGGFTDRNVQSVTALSYETCEG